MIACLFGSTSVGKTTIAQMLARQLRIPLRSCGDEVRAMAKSVGVSVAELADSAHEAVDRETVAWAVHNRPCVIEGRFLDSVFADGDRARLIHLACSEATRVARARARVPSFGLADLRRSDTEDGIFRNRVYRGLSPILPFVTVDTTHLSVQECVECIRSILGEEFARPT